MAALIKLLGQPRIDPSLLQQPNEKRNSPSLDGSASPPPAASCSLTLSVPSVDEEQPTFERALVREATTLKRDGSLNARTITQRLGLRRHSSSSTRRPTFFQGQQVPDIIITPPDSDEDQQALAENKSSTYSLFLRMLDDIRLRTNDKESTTSEGKETND